MFSLYLTLTRCLVVAVPSHPLFGLQSPWVDAEQVRGLGERVQFVSVRVDADHGVISHHLVSAEYTSHSVGKTSIILQRYIEMKQTY